MQIGVAIISYAESKWQQAISGTAPRNIDEAVAVRIGPWPSYHHVQKRLIVQSVHQFLCRDTVTVTRIRIPANSIGAAVPEIKKVARIVVREKGIRAELAKGV